jgi:hypothetical protein
LKIFELYRRDDNPLFVPETGGLGKARFLFKALGLGAIGFAPFGLDYTGAPITSEAAKAREEFLAPWAENNRLLGPMQREIARLNFEGKLQAVAEEQGKTMETLHFGSWDAVVTYGAPRRGAPAANGTPKGRALVAQLKDNQFLVTGLACTVDFRPAGTDAQRKSGQIVIGTGQNPSAQIDGLWLHRQFLRVEEGIYEDGKFKFQRIWNGDETDWGLSFTSVPQAVRVSLGTY